jgi:hypothetical protein
MERNWRQRWWWCHCKFKIQEFNDGQYILRSVKDQDELKKKEVYRAISWLERSFNPEASTMLQNIEQGRRILLEETNVVLFSGIVIDEEPTTFDEAWNHEDPAIRENG